MKKILETERLILREMDSAIDAEFVLELLNTPGFLKYIGDRGVRTLAQAIEFIDNRYRKSYLDHGYGLYAVDLKADRESGTLLTVRVSAGMCGFVQRDGLPEADIGFAFLPQFEKRGYAFESAEAVMRYGREALGFTRILAITTPDNETSGRLLEKLGFSFEALITIPPSDEELKLFASDVV